MAARTRFTPTIATRHHRQYRLGPGLERPIGRVVVVLLLVTLLAVLPLASSLAGLGPSEQAQRLAHLTPRQLLGEGTSHFLPTPIAAMAPEANAGPPAPAAGESTSEDYTAAGAEQVKVANTGGLGVLLRSDPPSGRLVASLAGRPGARGARTPARRRRRVAACPHPGGHRGLGVRAAGRPRPLVWLPVRVLAGRRRGSRQSACSSFPLG
jgi:hypothetical protein